jgi:FkbM family methyltransferase
MFHIVKKRIRNIFRIIRLSLNSSISSRFPILTLPRDGEFLHFWPLYNAIYSLEPLARPRDEGKANYPLFTWGYKPKKGDVVLDLGCGIGTELADFSRAVGKTGLVIAVDASLDCVRLARLTVSLLRLNNVRVIHAAIGEKDGVTSFPSEGTGLTNRMLSNDSDQVQVPLISIETVLKNHSIRKVDLLKMNIEGAEILAVQGVPASSVVNFAISCHDFIGDPSQKTFSSIWDWGQQNNFMPRTNKSHSPGSCESFYVYGKYSG